MNDRVTLPVIQEVSYEMLIVICILNWHHSILGKPMILGLPQQILQGLIANHSSYSLLTHMLDPSLQMPLLLQPCLIPNPIIFYRSVSSALVSSISICSYMIFIMSPMFIMIFHDTGTLIANISTCSWPCTPAWSWQYINTRPCKWVCPCLKYLNLQLKFETVWFM